MTPNDPFFSQGLTRWQHVRIGFWLGLSDAFGVPSYTLARWARKLGPNLAGHACIWLADLFEVGYLALISRASSVQYEGYPGLEADDEGEVPF